MARFTMKQWRLLNEKSQEEMAEACGVHRNTYAKWEENPDTVKIGDAKKFAAALRISVDDIFFGTDSTNLWNIAATQEVV